MPKIVTLSLAAAALVGAGGIAYAQAERDAPVTRAQVEQRSAERFARMDANDDGKLDQADRAGRRQDRQRQAFDRLDADDSGAISFEELTAGREQRGEARAERRGPDGPRFGRRGGRGGPGPVNRLGARAADADNDGAVSQAEFTTAALARFDRIDANKDGTIGADERRQPRRMMRRPRDAG